MYSHLVKIVAPTFDNYWLNVDSCCYIVKNFRNELPLANKPFSKDGTKLGQTGIERNIDHHLRMPQTFIKGTPKYRILIE